MFDHAFQKNDMVKTVFKYSRLVILLIFLISISFFFLNFVGKVRVDSTNEIIPVRKMPENHLLNVSKKPKREYKIVLFWTQFFGGRNSFLDSHGEGARLKNCPVNECLLTDDKEWLRKSDALIFHPLDMDQDPAPTDRLPHQYYIYFVLESPHHSGVGPADFFNLTFTYRLDSDIIADNYLQYFRPSLWTSKTDFDDLWAQKTSEAVIFMTNCEAPSNRMQYVQLLQQYLPVDIVGGCGDIECQRSDEKKCNSMIKKYKFYLAFENSICKDYISEKIIRAFDYGAIPIVMGGANYSQIFPVNSVINVLDYETPRALAEYLKYLSGNKIAYFNHFKWRFRKEFTRLPPYLAMENVSLCKLCELLHEKPRKQKIVSNLQKWWIEDANCLHPDWMETPTLKTIV